MRWENDQHVIQVLPAPYSQQVVGSPGHCMINPGCSRRIWIVKQPVQGPMWAMCTKSPERTQVAGSPHGGQMFLFFPKLHEKTSSKLLPSILFPSFLSEGFLMWQKVFWSKPTCWKLGLLLGKLPNRTAETQFPCWPPTKLGTIC